MILKALSCSRLLIIALQKCDVPCKPNTSFFIYQSLTYYVGPLSTHLYDYYIFIPQ